MTAFMTFTEAVSRCFHQYATFDGTARRSEFWWFLLFYLGGGLLLWWISRWLTLAFALAAFVPAIAVTCRRLHDTDRSGWVQLINLIPGIGQVVLLVFMVQNSRPNRYGIPAGAPA